jgi:diguanylate cyclase (GGDEF)-like protein
MARVAGQRLDWRDPEHHLGVAGDRGAIARTLAYLFGFGGVLLLATLALPGSPDRDEAALIAISIAAVVVAAVLIAGFDRLPWRALVVAPAMGTALIVLVISFAGPEGSAAYAMYLSWVVIAAGGYLSRRQTAAHGAVAVAGYWLALEITGPSAVPTGLQLAMAAGTAAVAAFVMAGLATHMRGVVSRLEDDARTDPLTGLDNRRALRAEFGRELARAERTGRPLAFVVLDLDHFKEYNDALGHLAGDDALQRVAGILEEITRSVEVTARIGGEEFAIVAPDTDGKGGFALAERLRVGVEREFASSRQPLTISAGVAVHWPGRQREGDLVAAADRALYAAKDAGRNQVVLASEGRRFEPKEPVELKV